MSADKNTTKLPPISTFSHDGEDHQKPLSFKTTLLTAPPTQNSVQSQYLYPSSHNTSCESLPSISSPYYYSQSVAPVSSNSNNSSKNGSSDIPSGNGTASAVIRNSSPHLETHQGSITSSSDISKHSDFYK